MRFKCNSNVVYRERLCKLLFTCEGKNSLLQSNAHIISGLYLREKRDVCSLSRDTLKPNAVNENIVVCETKKGDENIRVIRASGADRLSPNRKRDCSRGRQRTAPNVTMRHLVIAPVLRAQKRPVQFLTKRERETSPKSERAKSSRVLVDSTVIFDLSAFDSFPRSGVFMEIWCLSVFI